MKVYKITLYVSWLVFAIFAALSVALNFWNGNVWISFINDWCVGIACSIVVVFVTTLIQFKVEQKKILNELASSVRALLFENVINGEAFEEGAEKEMNAKQIATYKELWRKETEETIEQITEICGGLEFLFKKKAMLTIRKNCFLIRVDLITNEIVEEVYANAQAHIYELAESLLHLTFAEYNREEIARYVREYKKKAIC